MYQYKELIDASQGFHKVQNLLTGEFYLAKVYDKTMMSQDLKKGFLKELKIWQSLTGHPSILSLLEIYEEPEIVITISELCTGGTLNQYLSLHKHIAEPLTKQFFSQLIQGLIQLKEKGIVHRCLSLDSIILCQSRKNEGELTARICNFSQAEKFIRGKSKLLSVRCGCPGFMAPEVINEKQYDEKVDVFSVGVILYAMFKLLLLLCLFLCLGLMEQCRLKEGKLILFWRIL